MSEFQVNQERNYDRSMKYDINMTLKNNNHHYFVFIVWVKVLGAGNVYHSHCLRVAYPMIADLKRAVIQELNAPTTITICTPTGIRLPPSHLLTNYPASGKDEESAYIVDSGSLSINYMNHYL
jgi:hypothetical protein